MAFSNILTQVNATLLLMTSDLIRGVMARTRMTNKFEMWIHFLYFWEAEALASTSERKTGKNRQKVGPFVSLPSRIVTNLQGVRG